MRHRPVGGEHGVLVRPEVRQTPVDEVPQRPSGLVRGDGEPAGAVAADGRQVHPIEVGPHFGVDGVLLWLPRRRHLQGGRAARRGLAVGVVVVPLAAQRVGAVHEHVEATPPRAVELLHAEGGALASPVGELLAGQRERRRRQDLGDEPVLTEALDEVGCGVRGRLVHDHRPSHLLQGLAVGLGAQVARAVTQLRGQVPHAGQHEMQLLTVERPASQHPRRLDEHDLAVGMPAVDVWPELVGEDPQRSVGHHASLPGHVGLRSPS